MRRSLVFRWTLYRCSILALSATVALAGACSPADPAPQDPAPQDPAPQDPAPQDPAERGTAQKASPSLNALATARLVDLTYSFDDGTLYWPTSPSSFELTSLAHGETDGGYFYSSNSFCTPEHGGTHLDAPIHFAQGGQAVEEIPLRHLLGPAVVIDVTAQAAENSDYRLTRQDVEAFEGKHGTIAEGTIVLLRTGWGARWPDRASYFGDDTVGDASGLHFPSYGKEAAELLVQERQVAVLGVDTASIDCGPSTDFIVHRIANGANVPGLENIANLEAVPATGAWVIALPMKIAGGSGGPVRIVALVGEDT